MERPQLLTFEEIERLARIAAGLGVTKLRLTGGEPLLRRQIDKLVGMLARVPGIQVDEDFDFIQGSRYIDGGKAIGMPATRDFLIIVVHAPIFSFLCGWRFTDTTNGFRACSMMLLSSPQFSLFRSVFKGYDIVFYLPWAACRYGFRVTEIPVTRAYPADGTVPSHLNSVIGYWRMLRPLLMLATRRF